MTQPSSPEAAKKVVKMAPLEIQTTQAIGIPIPIGVVMNELRTNPNQAVVVDEQTGMVALVTRSSESENQEQTLQDTTIAGVAAFSYVFSLLVPFIMIRLNSEIFNGFLELTSQMTIQIWIQIIWLSLKMHSILFTKIKWKFYLMSLNLYPIRVLRKVHLKLR